MSLRDAIATQLRTKAELAKRPLELQLTDDTVTALREQAAFLQIAPNTLLSLIVNYGVYEINTVLEGNSDTVATTLGLNNHG